LAYTEKYNENWVNREITKIERLSIFSEFVLVYLSVVSILT